MKNGCLLYIFRLQLWINILIIVIHQSWYMNYKLYPVTLSAITLRIGFATYSPIYFFNCYFNINQTIAENCINIDKKESFFLTLWGDQLQTGVIKSIIKLWFYLSLYCICNPICRPYKNKNQNKFKVHVSRSRQHAKYIWLCHYCWNPYWPKIFDMWLFFNERMAEIVQITLSNRNLSFEERP